MTGKDLIIHILEHNLENKDVTDIFKTVNELSVVYEVGPATVEAWYKLGAIHGIKIGDEVYFLPF